MSESQIPGKAPTLSAVGKGQLRCFSCRKAHPIKDGGWHTRDSKQVFLCRVCEKKPASPTRGGIHG